MLALRADLMAQLEQTLKARKMTQVAASKVLGVSQGRVSDCVFRPIVTAHFAKP